MADRAVLYARVSGDDRGKEGRNLAGQIAMGRDYAKRKGYDVVREMSEDEGGASGAEIDLPQLSEIRDMAQRREFEVLVVRELDRLSRNLAKQLIVEEELRRAKVRIEYIIGEYPDTPEGDLMKHVRAAVAEYEREKIKERVSRGYRLKVESGSVLILGNNPPFGYHVIKDGAKWRLEIEEKEAQIVRLIFNWFTMGDESGLPMTIGQITKKLSEAGLSSPADVRGRRKNRPAGQWGRSSVANILRNETYAGLWRFGKRPQSTGRLPVDNDKTLAVEVPALISWGIWHVAATRLANNAEHSPRNVKHKYLLRRRVTCECGLKMGCRTHNEKRGENKALSYYACPGLNRRLVARECHMPLFRADALDAAVWSWVEQLILDPARLAAGYADYSAELGRQNAPLLKRCELIDGLLSEQRSQLERLLDLYLAGTFDKQHLTDRKMRFEKTIESLEVERNALMRQVKQAALTERDIQTLQEFGDKIRATLGSEALKTFTAKSYIIDLLDVRARVAIEDGCRVAYVSCAIAEDLICLNHDNPTRACASSAACRIPSGCTCPSTTITTTTASTPTSSFPINIRVIPAWSTAASSPPCWMKSRAAPPSSTATTTI